MADGTGEDASGPAIDILGNRRGFVGGVVGVEDWDLSRMRDAREMVVYDFGSRHGAMEACKPLKLALDMRLLQVDDTFNPGCEVMLGSGEGPPPGTRYPYKFRVVAPHGFSLDPMRTFERVVEILRAGAWDEMPAVRSGPAAARKEPAEAEEDGASTGAGGSMRLGASPRLVPQGRGTYAEHMFQIPVKGYLRGIRADRYGLDEHGAPILGKNWVNGYDKGKDTKPVRPADHPLEIRRRIRLGIAA